MLGSFMDAFPPSLKHQSIMKLLESRHYNSSQTSHVQNVISGYGQKNSPKVISFHLKIFEFNTNLI